MKNLISNIDEAMALVNSISEFDDVGMKSIICMLIDTASCKYKEPAGDIADTICTMVHAVNEELGAYTF